MDTLRKPGVPPVQVGTPATGPRVGGSHAVSEEPPELFIDLPIVEGTYAGPRLTHGGRIAETSPCGKCGCEFINVVCPVHWPIESVALCCATCGSVVEYIDGLLLLSVKQAVSDRTGRAYANRRRVSVEIPTGLSGLGTAKELVQMGIDGGLTDQDIAEAMGVSEEYVAIIAQLISRG